MNDVFISYAHIDDQALTEGQKGWISQFHHVLELRLAQLLGEQPKIWRDKKLQGNDIFDDKIINAFNEAKVMVSIMSPRYMKSEWCLRELNEFYKTASEKSGIKVGEKSRIFKVIKTPIDAEDIPEQLPPVLKSILGFEFFDYEKDTGRLVEYDETFGEKAKQNYFNRIFDLAHEICSILKSYNRSGIVDTDNQNDKKNRKKIYLAATSSDLQPERDRIKRELTERGHTVYPDENLPLTNLELEDYLKKALPNCDLSIHMIGSKYGLIPEDSNKSVTEIQNFIAAETSNLDNLERIIWVPPGLISSDDRQIEFIEKINEDNFTQAGAEIIEESLDNLRGYILDRLKPNESTSPLIDHRKANPNGSKAKSIYLICDATDEAKIEPIEDYLFDQGFEVSLPLFEGDEAVISQSHRKKLTHCDSVLIYYGSGGRSWIEMTIMDLAQAPGFGRTKPFLSKSVLIAPPEDRRKSRFKTHLADIYIQENDEFNSECISSLINQIK